ncbi:MAG: hypothetical protein ACOC1G_00365 [Phycisphaeraceae bacterium]
MFAAQIPKKPTALRRGLQVELETTPLPLSRIDGELRDRSAHPARSRVDAQMPLGVTLRRRFKVTLKRFQVFADTITIVNSAAAIFDVGKHRPDDSQALRW